MFQVDAFVAEARKQEEEQEQQERERRKRVAEAVPAMAGWGTEGDFGEDSTEGSSGRSASGDDAEPSGTESEEEEEMAGGHQSRIRKGEAALSEEGLFQRLLRAGADDGDYTSLVALLRRMTPAQIDGEVRQMETFVETATAEDLELVGLFLGFLETELASNRNFEFLNAVLRVFLEVHGDVIAADPGLRVSASPASSRTSCDAMVPARVWATLLPSS